MKLYKYFLCLTWFLFSSRIIPQEINGNEFRTQLWSTKEPGCILVYNPNHEKLELPAPYTPPSIPELFGQGTTEEKLINQKIFDNRYRIQKVQVGNNITFNVTFADGPNEGFNDPTLGPSRQAAFLFGMQVWGNYLQGPAAISIQATMTSRGGTAGSAVLASGTSGSFFKDFQNTPITNTWYPKSLVKIISGSDPNDTIFEINIDFNSDVDNSTVLGNKNFYYGTDGLPGTDVDFVTITIHELCHGLGFLDSFNSNGAYDFDASSTFPDIYDRFLVDSTGTLLINKPTSPNNVTGNNVFWGGRTAKYIFDQNFNTSKAVPLFAPTPYQGGSSVSHLDEATFNGIFELQTPVNNGTVHIPDDIVLGILQDIGYSLTNSRYVDLSADGFEDGSSANPFDALWKGIVSVPQNGTLRLRADEYDVSSGNNGPATLDKPMTIASFGGTATIILSSSAQPVKHKNIVKLYNPIKEQKTKKIN
ncbi:MAG TPA: hypothetical protein VMT35_04750 [Ignavibacteriaceae bacterium]|nr:hypothetical protein [Ignavibacteriaceae bacterium]